MQIDSLDYIEPKLAELSSLGVKEFAGVDNSGTLEQLRVQYFGDKSYLAQLRKNMRLVPAEDKPRLGKLINAAQSSLEEAFKQAKQKIESQELEAKLMTERIDVSLPGTGTRLGHLHPLEQSTREILSIFKSMGFSLVDGPEIETGYYNFTALNTPEDHPARDEQDTFYTSLSEGLEGDQSILLRSHTSSIQIRAMQKLKPPFRIMGYGRVYRNEEVNARKMPFFHQLELMMVDKDINFGHMKWVLSEFLKSFFGEDLEPQFRPDFFPFTEPSAEVDLTCVFCRGKGCSTCGFRGRLELMGCGMIDPNVLQMAGIDPEQYSGFAAGLGLDRFTMLKYGIKDIRYMFNGDQRFLEQF